MQTYSRGQFRFAIPAQVVRSLELSPSPHVSKLVLVGSHADADVVHLANRNLQATTLVLGLRGLHSCSLLLSSNSWRLLLVRSLGHGRGLRR